MIHFPPPKILQVASLSIACLLWSSPADTQQEIFPFLAEVTSADVNVRAGQSPNFERLCQLAKGDEVVVIGRNFSWYQIQLPPGTKAYISDKYVQLVNRQEGRIISNDVNIRAGAGIHHTILGQLPIDARVRILQKIQEWYQIEAPDSASGWIADQFVAFKSRYIASYRPAQPILPEDLPAREQPASSPVPSGPVSEKNVEAKVSSPALEFLSQVSGDEEKRGGAVSVQGVLEVLRNAPTGSLQYQILVDGRPAYYVSGLKHIFEKFERRRVSVEGGVDPGAPNAGYPYPVLLVSKIQLMF